jgi:hypothetical protein
VPVHGFALGREEQRRGDHRHAPDASREARRQVGRDQRAGVVTDDVEGLCDAEALDALEQPQAVVAYGGQGRRRVGIAEAGRIRRQNRTAAHEAPLQALIDAPAHGAHVECNNGRAPAARVYGEADMELPARRVYVRAAHRTRLAAGQASISSIHSPAGPIATADRRPW